jgi:3-hydroxyisobutyrate dehydrogenase
MKIGWIGTGVMGISMAGHLQAAGHSLFVYNRTRQKAVPLLERGAVWCETPAEIGAQVEAVFSMVGYPEDVEEVWLDPESGLFARPGCRLAIDMTTSSPDLAVQLALEGAALDIAVLDAPVSGGDIGARNAALAIMVGGSPEAFAQARPLFELLGKNIALLGPAGSGQHAKMCNQILIAGNMIGVCEALLYAERARLDPAAVIEIVGKGAAGSWSINNLGPRIVAGNYDPGFYIEHFLKDMGIALDECRRQRITLPGLELAYGLYRRLLASGRGRLGTQALMLALRELNQDYPVRLEDLPDFSAGS